MKLRTIFVGLGAAASWSHYPIDWMWGDRSGVVVLLRTVIKTAFVLWLALFVHEGLASSFLSFDKDQLSALRSSFEKANDILIGITPPSDLPYKSVSLCLDVKPSIADGCPDTLFGSPGIKYAIGYQLLIHNKKDNTIAHGAGGTIYQVAPRVVSSAQIVESVDTLLRKIEFVAFNGTTKSITEARLCNGTRTLEISEKCTATKRIGEELGAPDSGIWDPDHKAGAANTITLQTAIDSIRYRSLVFGPVQFGTLCIFLFAALETLGLWLRWVAPRTRLFSAVTTRQNGKTTTTLIPNPESLDDVLGSPTRSLADRLYLVDLKAAANTPGSPPATREEYVSIHSSYRDYLQEDAITRQDFLETLGDTMLKLAFLGTVLGISTALFAARGLDTADPILRLSTKAEMYSGIGMGFGTTLLGIALSIIAAQLRTMLAAAWAGRIGTAYQLILDFGVDGMRNMAQHVKTEAIVRISDFTRVADRKRTPTEIVGMIAVLAVTAFLVFTFRAQLAALLRALVNL